MKTMSKIMGLLLALMVSFTSCENDDSDADADAQKGSELPDISGYPIVGTNQTTFFNNATSISAPASGEDFYGQNAHYPGNTPQYQDNGDGTVTDLVTGLMWQQTLDHNGDGVINYDDKLTYSEILAAPDTVTTGGYDDWRVPTIKEQYSLIMFSGRDVSGYGSSSTDELVPFINTDIFGYAYGDTDAGERLIDVQCASTNVYVSTEVEYTIFGVNFADGRIKGYGNQMMGQDKAFNYLLVRGRTDYGENDFVDNGDKTVIDHATGLMWMQDDNGAGITWQEALSYAEGTEFAGYSDWRLPDAKELQSIVDYTRSPSTSNSASIDPVFNCTQITNEAGQTDYPFYWSSTTHGNWTEGNDGAWGAYVSFGRCMGNMSTETGGTMPPLNDGSTTPPGGGTPPNNGTPPGDGSTSDDGTLAPPTGGPNSGIATTNWIDVHGAGAQRSDPKAGDPSQYATGNGPQGDAIRIYNHVRLVRNVN